MRLPPRHEEVGHRLLEVRPKERLLLPSAPSVLLLGRVGSVHGPGGGNDTTGVRVTPTQILPVSLGLFIGLPVTEYLPSLTARRTCTCRRACRSLHSVEAVQFLLTYVPRYITVDHLDCTRMDSTCGEDEHLRSPPRSSLRAHHALGWVRATASVRTELGGQPQGGWEKGGGARPDVWLARRAR